MNNNINDLVDEMLREKKKISKNSRFFNMLRELN